MPTPIAEIPDGYKDDDVSGPPPDDVIPSPGSAAGGAAVLPILLGGAVVVAALYFGQDLAVPLVLASMLAFVLAPLCSALQRLRLPRALAVLVAVLVSFAVLGGLGTIVGRQAASLASGLPAYQSTVTAKWQALAARVGAVEKLTRELGLGATGNSGGKDRAARSGEAPAEAKGGLGLPEGVSGLSLARNVAQPILGPLGTLGVTLIFAFFILVGHEDLRDRFVRLVGRRDLHRTILAMNDAASRLSRFFLFQLALNASFGAGIGVALGFAGLPSPLLWGILAGVMRFVPFIGVVAAAVPPLLLAVAITPGWTLVVAVLVLFVAAESLMGQVVEPLIYGQNTGLSPLAVIVATAFWALLWGPIGLILATPLTVCLVVLGRHVEALAFIDVILGDEPPLDPPETFYQRALEGRGMALLPDARARIAAASLADYCDRVILPGLALAQHDLARDDAAFERLDAIHGEIKALLAEVRAHVLARGSRRSWRGASAGESVAGKGAAVPPLPPAWQGEAAIVCVPGRGQLDDLAARMVVDALGQAGFGASDASNLILGAKTAMEPRFANARICCLSVLEDGSTEAAIRYFLQRMGKQMPDAVLVVGLWHAGRDSALLAALRAGEGGEHVVLSLGELIAFCQALAMRRPDHARLPAPTHEAAGAGA